MKKILIVIMIMVIMILVTGCDQDETINASSSNTVSAEDTRIINNLKQSTFYNYKTTTERLFSMFPNKVDWVVDEVENNPCVIVTVYKENNVDPDIVFGFSIHYYGDSEYFELEVVAYDDVVMTYSESQKFFKNMYIVNGIKKMGEIMDKLEKERNGN